MPSANVAAVVGLAVDAGAGGTLAAFWERVETRGISAGTTPLAPHELRRLVEEYPAGNLHLFAPAGMLAAAHLHGFEYSSLAACLEGAVRDLQASDGPVLAGVAGNGGAIVMLCKLSDAERQGRRIYAVIRQETHEGPVLGGDTPEHLAAAILAVYYRVSPPGFLRDTPGDRSWPWIHPAGKERRLLVCADGRLPLAISEPRGAVEPMPPNPALRHLFLLSAPDVPGLLRRVGDLHDRVDGARSEDLMRLAVSAGRAPAAEHRLAVVASSHQDLRDKLSQAREVLRDPTGAVRTRAGIYYGHGPMPGKVAMLFPGQGSQYPGMLREIAMRSPAIRSWFDHLDAAYERAGEPLPSAVWNGAANRPERLFDLQTGAQLGLVASLAMHELLVALGVPADCMLGHSNGEHAALLAAGVIRSRDRASLCDELCQVGVAARHLERPAIPEGMIAVSPVKTKLLDRLLHEHAGELFLAIDNCPSQVLLGGTVQALEKAREVLRLSGAICAVLPFERAHHTPLFSDWATLLRGHYSSVDAGAGQAPVYSTATIDRFPADATAIGELMADQWSRTVRFREAVEHLYRDGVRVFVETGPDGKLCSFVKDTLRGRPHMTISVSSSVRDDVSSLLSACADFYVSGIALRTEALDRLLYGAPLLQPAASPANLLREPVLTEHRATMAMAAAAGARVKQRMLVRGAGALEAGAEPFLREWPLTGDLQSLTYKRAVFSRTFELQRDVFLRDHSMGNSKVEGRSVPVLALTFSAALATEAAVRFAGGFVTAVSQVRAHRWLALDLGPLPLRIEVSRLNPLEVKSRVQSTPVQVHVYDLTGGTPALAFEAVVTIDVTQTQLPPLFPDSVAGPPPRRWTAARFYDDYAFHGPSYQTIRNVRALSGNRIEAELEVRETPGVNPRDWLVDASLLDAAGQLAAFWLIESGEEGRGLFPFSLEDIRLAAAPPMPGTTVLCRGSVERSRFGSTRASFDFVLPDGRIHCQVQGLEQKIVQFPGRLAECLFGKTESLSICEEVAAPAGIFVSWIDPERANFLQANQGLWGRVLARTVLSGDEFAHFSSLSTDARIPWLLGQIAVRDSVRRWTAARGAAHAQPPDTASCARSGFAAAAAMDHPGQGLRLEVTLGTRTLEDRFAAEEVLWQTEAGGYRMFLLSEQVRHSPVSFG